MATNGETRLRYGSRLTDAPIASQIAALRSLLAVRARTEIVDRAARRAAVLVPLVAAARGLEILCFERTDTVHEHKGEICFPGGAVDPGDATAVAAALREAHEELGIAAADVDVLGLLDDTPTTVSNYIITPVVGFIAAPKGLVPDALEVARPISFSLADIVAGGAQTFQRRMSDGTTRMLYSFSAGGDHIWGATARILHGMLSAWLGSEGDGS